MRESRAGGRPLDRSARPDRPTRRVGRGSNRPRKQANQPPIREPAGNDSGVHDGLSVADIRVTREVRPEPRPGPFPLSSLRPFQTLGLLTNFLEAAARLIRQNG